MVVRELDHFQYRKMRKLMYLDEQQPLTNSYDSTSATSNGTNTPTSKEYAADIFDVFFLIIK